MMTFCAGLPAPRNTVKPRNINSLVKFISYPILFEGDLAQNKKVVGDPHTPYSAIYVTLLSLSTAWNSGPRECILQRGRVQRHRSEPN
jgi:hypothetical protein